MVEIDEGYWLPPPPIVEQFATFGADFVEKVTKSTPAQAVTLGAHAANVAEQVTAGLTLILIGAFGASVYDAYKNDATRKR